MSFAERFSYVLALGFLVCGPLGLLHLFLQGGFPASPNLLGQIYADTGNVMFLRFGQLGTAFFLFNAAMLWVLGIFFVHRARQGFPVGRSALVAAVDAYLHLLCAWIV